MVVVGNVTFVGRLVDFQSKWLAYHRQSDTTIGVATCDQR